METNLTPKQQEDFTKSVKRRLARQNPLFFDKEVTMNLTGTQIMQREENRKNRCFKPSITVNPLLKCDGYKLGHRQQYPEGTELVYINFTPRKSRVEGVEYMRFFGFQAVMDQILNDFHVNFFCQPKDVVVNEYKRVVSAYLGKDVDVEHVAKLHDLGYLPINACALPEGSKVPMGVPCMTMWNTVPEFFWLPNYLETIISDKLWMACTSATTAGVFKERFDYWAEKTGADKNNFVPFQGHDFSFRGMAGEEAAMMSGAAHLIPFVGTDTIPALRWLEHHYDADVTKELVGCSVDATEHSVMCAGGMDNELETFRRLIEDVYPTGIVSIVSDTWDFWKLVTEFLPLMKSTIMARWKKDPTSKVVIRPDSGTPHKILNGDPDADTEHEKLGLIGCLHEIFGAEENEAGFYAVHPCIGAIYGDGINFAEQERILKGLHDNGYVSTSVVLGMGSYTYQYVTRDTFGTVCKATYCEINGEPREIFKSPKTGAWKKSHRGLLRVDFGLPPECADMEYDELTWEPHRYYVTEQVSWEEQGGALEPIIENGDFVKRQILKDVRDTFHAC